MSSRIMKARNMYVPIIGTLTRSRQPGAGSELPVLLRRVSTNACRPAERHSPRCRTPLSPSPAPAGAGCLLPFDALRQLALVVEVVASGPGCSLDAECPTSLFL